MISNCTRCRLEIVAVVPGQPAQQAVLRVCRLEIAVIAPERRHGKAQPAREAISRAERCGEPAVVRLAARVRVPRRMIVCWGG